MEFAVCLPFVLATVFGAIEAGNVVYLQNALTSAAYEGGNVAAAVGGTSQVATDRTNAVLTLLNVKGAKINISPQVDTNTKTGTTIVVTVSAPLTSNQATAWNLGKITLTASYTINHL